MKTYTKQELDEILRLHKLWLEDNKEGVRADLRSADLSRADLSLAYLSRVDLSKRYIQISCIGSRKGMTTYCFDDDKIWCGCYTGTLAEFEKRVKEKHKDNKQYAKEYLGFIEYLKSLKEEV